MCDTVADSYDAMKLLACSNGVAVGLFAYREAYPAAVEAQRLCQQHDALAIISHLLVGAFGCYHCQIVAYTLEVAVFYHTTGESLRLVGDQLYVQPSLLIAQCNLFIKDINNLRLDGLLMILSHRMACDDGFLQCHICGIKYRGYSKCSLFLAAAISS